MKPILHLPLLLAALLGAAGRAAGTEVPEPVHLRCEYAVNPLGVDVAQPRLFWELSRAARGERQSAWQVLAASSAALLDADRGDLWDSGRVASDQTIQVPYAGRPLRSSQPVFWKVRLWDQDGRPSAWSAPATWTMGLLAPEDWKGIWIAAPGATETLLLRHEFEVKPGLRRAVVCVCGLGQYELTLDGTRVGDDRFTPGWTDYDKTALYDTYDVTALLHAGRNAAGLFLGNGMYSVVRRNRFAKFTGSFGPLRAILHLRLEYADGSVVFVGTDDTWRTHAGPDTSCSIYSGEDYDARRALPGWDRPGFDDRSWLRAVPVILLHNALRGQSVAANPLRVIAERRPVAVRRLAPDRFVYDLGQNTSYVPRIRVRGPAGSTVRLTPAEIVNPDGTINRSTMGGAHRGSSWWQYTKATDGEETWTPGFYYVGCRYLQADLIPPDGEPDDSAHRPTIESLEGLMVHSDAAPVGEFKTSNELLNRIRDLVRWAQQSNMVSVLTDCPHREKLGWLEQYHLNGPALRYEFDVSRIFTKGMHDMADAQDADGLVPNIAPEYVRFKGAFRAAAEWGAAFISVPWQQYRFEGDVALLRTYYPAMVRYLRFLESQAHDDILAEGLGDWYDLGPKKPGPAQLTPAPVTATAFFYHDAWVLSQVAALLGRPDDAREFAGLAARIRASYNRHFFHPESGTYATGSQCANALPLVMGIVAPADRPAVLAALVRDVEQRGDEMTAGDIGFRYLLQALAEGGRSDVIYRMINQDDKPGYGYMLKQGATSLTESWNANRSSSWDHFMLGQITEWFYRDLAGIDDDPAGPGFQKIILRPQPVGDLQWVTATYHSIHGPITVHWEHDPGRFVLRADIPANTTATVFLPARPGTAVTEGGAPADRSPGVTFLRREGDRAVYAIESGGYQFASQW
jgi:alpha-L-rhamnosidase